ncbi:helix-turn-helix domain-containing protein [Halonotius sp. GCM10025705]|uniref:helix-turn-helix domain-containing protein n=1 Tax=Halonotius sp. GCM10025705 TaxID=3252678 RepID=UPI00361FD6ED
MSSNLDREATEWATQQEPTHPYVTPGSATGPEISTPSMATVLEMVLGLRSQELAVYDAITTDPGASTKTLAGTLDRDRSNVNRSLTKLEAAGLVTRHRRILDSGGYYYANYAAPSDVVDDIVSTALDRWAAAAQSMLTDQQWETPLAGSTDS